MKTARMCVCSGLGRGKVFGGLGSGHFFQVEVSPLKIYDLSGSARWIPEIHTPGLVQDRRRVWFFFFY